MRLITSALIGVVSLATLFSASAVADNFRGILDDKGRPVPVVLVLHPDAEAGASAGYIRFEGAWACGFDLEVAQVAAQRRTYFLKGAGAGRCTLLTSGYLYSQPADQGLAIRLSDSENRMPALYRMKVQPTGS